MEGDRKTTNSHANLAKWLKYKNKFSKELAYSPKTGASQRAASASENPFRWA